MGPWAIFPDSLLLHLPTYLPANQNAAFAAAFEHVTALRSTVVALVAALGHGGRRGATQVRLWRAAEAFGVAAGRGRTGVRRLLPRHRLVGGDEGQRR